MRRKVIIGAICGVLLAAGLTGCGIPERSEVQVDGRGPAAEAGESSYRPDEPRTQKASGSEPQAFVLNFLSAAAGEPERAYSRVRQFIAPADRALLKEKQVSEIAVNVIRLVEKPVITDQSDGTFLVRLSVQQVGVLRANDTLVPPAVTETRYTFRLRSAAPPGQESNTDAGLFVVGPPNVLLLSDVALRQYYETRTVYFWNFDRARLVPDQRYLPLAVPDERRVTEVVNWLTDGPSDWLRPGVTGLPDRTTLINNATGTDGRWEINLNMPGEDDKKLDQLATQLAWSLPELDGQLELKVLNQSRLVIPDLKKRRLSHPAYPISDTPERFCVYDGAVHPLAFPDEPIGTVPVAPAVNRNVVSAGFSRADNGILAALVVTGADRKQHLTVGTGVAPVRDFTRDAKGYASIGRPVWLRSLDPARSHGLVVADGRLYQFDGSAGMTLLPLNVLGTVTAVAASLDGHRIAVVVGGALYVAAVNVDGGGVAAGPTRRLVTSLTGLSAVDWFGENSLVLAGSAGRSAVYEISVDGVLETALKDDIGARVTHLAAYPVNPVVTTLAAAAMYEANGVSYRSSPFEKILRDQVQEVTPPPTGVRPGNPTAPFFLY